MLMAVGILQTDHGLLHYEMNVNANTKTPRTNTRGSLSKKDSVNII